MSNREIDGEEHTARTFHVTFEADPVVYHTVHPTKEEKTACGLDIDDSVLSRFLDPGDALDQCEECREKAGAESRAELVKWIADEKRADFDIQSGSSISHFDNSQLQDICEYVSELEERANDG